MFETNEKEKLIIEQAKKLFIKFGIRSVSMDDLANSLGMSKKTLYAYFKDKKTLIEKILISELEKMDKMFQKVYQESENAIDLQLKINSEILKFIANQPSNVNYDLKKYYPDLWIKVKKIQNQKMFYAVVKNIKRGIKEGLIRKDIIPEIIAKIQIQRSFTLFDGTLEDLETKFSKQTVITEILKYHIYGICTEKGIEYFKSKFKQKNK